MRADAFEYLLGDVGMLGEDAGWADARARAEPRGAKPWELARLHERKTLVVGFEQLAPFVQTLAPDGVVGGDARVEHQVVVAAGHGEWVELDRAELACDGRLLQIELALDASACLVGNFPLLQQPVDVFALGGNQFRPEIRRREGSFDPV